MNLHVTLTKQLHKEEITASVWCGHKLRYMMLGFSDGTLRLYEIPEDKESTWEPKQIINAFVNINGKRGSVTSLKVHSETGAVYAASSLGTVKLLRV